MHKLALIQIHLYDVLFNVALDAQKLVGERLDVGWAAACLSLGVVFDLLTDSVPVDGDQVGLGVASHHLVHETPLHVLDALCKALELRREDDGRLVQEERLQHAVDASMLSLATDQLGL